MAPEMGTPRMAARRRAKQNPHRIVAQVPLYGMTRYKDGSTYRNLPVAASKKRVGFANNADSLIFGRCGACFRFIASCCRFCGRRRYERPPSRDQTSGLFGHERAPDLTKTLLQSFLASFAARILGCPRRQPAIKERLDSGEVHLS